MFKYNYNGKYEQIERIGNGAYGVIYKVKSVPQGEIYIAKHVGLHQVQREKAIKEFEIIKSLKHLYIVKYIDSIIEEEQLILIMEYCGERDLSWHIEQMAKKKKYFNQYLVTNWIFQLVMGLGFMHSKKIVHRDIKPQNIFVDSSMNLKLGDFGISTILQHSGQQCKTSAGTPSYMAPQMLENDHYTNKADIWSLGCVIYEMCSLQKVFPTKDKLNKAVGLFKIMEMIKQAQVKDIPQIYSDGLKRLVKKMLVKDPALRPSASQLLKDPVLVQLMINISSANLKQEYPKNIEKPTLTNSFIDRQTDSVHNQLQKFQKEVRNKMDSLRMKKVQGNQIDSYYQQIQKKMKQIENAVKVAFGEIKKQSNVEESSTVETNKSSVEDEDPTIKSIELSLQSKKSMKFNTVNNSNLSKSDLSSIQSQMVSSKSSGQDLNMTVQSNFDETFNSKFQETQQSHQISMKSKKQDPFDQTINSEYKSTIKEEDSIIEKTMNKLELLHNTIKKNPEAILSDSFLNCTLSLSGDQRKFQSSFKAKTEKTLKESMSLDLTKQIETSQEKSIGFKKKSTQKNEDESKNSKSEENEYEEDFEAYDQNQMNEAINDTRKKEMQSILQLYQQTIDNLSNNMNSTTESNKVRNKYLVMSEIKQQSNEGGSMISRENDSNL